MNSATTVLALASDSVSDAPWSSIWSSRRSFCIRRDPSGPKTQPTWAGSIRLEPSRSTRSIRLV